jgi:hypothetical protein
MRSKLSSQTLDLPTTELDANGRPKTRKAYPLRGLTTRDSGDPSIALLDAWATVADVLTFYQERIANEGYLRMATERRSVLELARLVGYALRPGVAASVWLTLELDKGYESTIQPYELKAQSIPGPGELPQTFENIEPFEARYAWNKLQPRLAQPQTVKTITQGQGLEPPRPRLYVKGISTNLKPNDVVLLTRGGGADKIIYHVAEVQSDPPNDRTLVIFQEAPADSKAEAATFDLMDLAKVAERYATTDVMDVHGVTMQSETAQAVIPLLQALGTHARIVYRTAEFAELAVRGALARITAVRKAVDAQTSPAEAGWLDAILKELNQAMTTVRVAAAREKARAFAEGLSTSPVLVPPLDLDPL